MPLSLRFNDNGFALYSCTCADYLRYVNTGVSAYKRPTNADILNKNIDTNYMNHEQSFFPCRHIYATMIAQGHLPEEAVPKEMKVHTLESAPPPASPVGFHDFGTSDRAPAPEELGTFDYDF